MDRTLRGLNASTRPNIVTISIIIIILIAFATRLSAVSSRHLFRVHRSQPPKGVQGGQPPSTDERQRLTDGWCELGAGVAAVAALAALAAAAAAALMVAVVTAATAAAAMAVVSLAILLAGLAVGHLRWAAGHRGICLQEVDLRATDFQEMHLRDTTVSHSSSSSSSSLWRLVLPLSSRKHCPRAR